jgi:hypothetical protein
VVLLLETRGGTCPPASGEQTTERPSDRDACVPARVHRNRKSRLIWWRYILLEGKLQRDLSPSRFAAKGRKHRHCNSIEGRLHGAIVRQYSKLGSGAEARSRLGDSRQETGDGE